MLVVFYRHSGIHMTRHYGHCVKTRRHPQNRKYTTYRNAVRGWFNHGRRQHAQKFGVGFELRERTHSQTTDRQTYILVHITIIRNRSKWLLLVGCCQTPILCVDVFESLGIGRHDHIQQSFVNSSISRQTCQKYVPLCLPCSVSQRNCTVVIVHSCVLRYSALN